MQIDDVRRVVVVGAGTMGLQIAVQCAAHGYEVAVYDADARALEAAQVRLRGYADALVAAAIPTRAAGDPLDRIATTRDAAEAAVEADILTESIPEDPVLKGRVLGEFNGLCPARTIFATNTSTLLPSMFATATGRPDRFASLHFHGPVWTSNVVDVMPHPGTSDETITLLVNFAHRIGQIPIRLHRESPGYVFNAMYNAINREAITLAANGVASIEDVDRAWMGIMRMPIGPFGMLDGVGLDTVLDITEYWARRTSDPQLTRNAAFIHTYVDAGRLGVKSGEGFYRYPNPSYRDPGFLTGSTG